MCLFTVFIDEREICVSSQHVGPGEVWFASPGRFPGEKMVQNGAPAGTANPGAGDAFCIVPRQSVTSVGPCEVPRVGGKQHCGQGAMGTGSGKPGPKARRHLASLGDFFPSSLGRGEALPRQSGVSRKKKSLKS